MSPSAGEARPVCLRGIAGLHRFAKGEPDVGRRECAPQLGVPVEPAFVLVKDALQHRPLLFRRADPPLCGDPAGNGTDLALAMAAFDRINW